jgi:hypothetical protein
MPLLPGVRALPFTAVPFARASPSLVARKCLARRPSCAIPQGPHVPSAGPGVYPFPVCQFVQALPSQASAERLAQYPSKCRPQKRAHVRPSGSESLCHVAIMLVRACRSQSLSNPRPSAPPVPSPKARVLSLSLGPRGSPFPALLSARASPSPTAVNLLASVPRTPSHKAANHVPSAKAGSLAHAASPIVWASPSVVAVQPWPQGPFHGRFRPNSMKNGTVPSAGHGALALFLPTHLPGRRRPRSMSNTRPAAPPVPSPKPRIMPPLPRPRSLTLTAAPFARA